MENESKSKTPMLIGIVVVVLVLVGGFIFLNSAQNSPQPTTRPTATTTTSATNSPTATNDPNVQTVSLTGANFRFNPSEIKVKKGQKVKIELEVMDMTHDFVIDELDVRTPIGKAGETVVVEFTATETGEFEYYCSIGNHKAQGMVGTLIVE